MFETLDTLVANRSGDDSFDEFIFHVYTIEKATGVEQAFLRPTFQKV